MISRTNQERPGLKNYDPAAARLNPHRIPGTAADIERVDAPAQFERIPHRRASDAPGHRTRRQVEDGARAAIAEEREYHLQAAIVVKLSGRAEIRYFRNPQDWEGVTIRLTTRLRAEWVKALEMPGFHPIERDDSEDAQMRLEFERSAA